MENLTEIINLPLNKLLEMPTLYYGAQYDLKMSKDKYRVWLSKPDVKVKDIPWDNTVLIEERRNNQWTTIAIFPGKFQH